MPHSSNSENEVEDKLTEDEIAGICMARFHTIDTTTSQIQDDREKALEYYNREPFGDEVDGLSDFVSSDVADTVEWLLPQLVEMFIGPEAPGAFAARNTKPEEAENARLETEYIRHVFNDQNDGFIIAYTWLKDALLQKNGVVYAYWDEYVNEVREVYEGKSVDHYLQILADDDVDVEAVTVRLPTGKDEYEEMTLEAAESRFGFEADPETGFIITDPEAFLQGQEALFDIEVIRKTTVAQPRIENIAPEKFFVDITHPRVSVRDAIFCGHWELVQISDLMTDGYDPEKLEDIPTSSESLDAEAIARFEKEGRSLIEEAFTDHGRLVKVWNFMIYDDLDGSGYAKLWNVKLAGDEGTIFLGKEDADSIGYFPATGNINPHKFYGNSIHDQIADLQKLRSRMWRGILDNLALVNSPMKIVDPNRVNTADLVYWGPGGTIRATDPTALVNHETPFSAGATVQLLPLIDEMRQERTGVSPATQGLDPDALADSTNVVGPMLMNQAIQRVKMVARIFAETGFKQLMLYLHELVMKHETQDRIFEFAGKPVEIKPREWAKRTAYTVRVGVGHVDKLQRIQAINQVIANQKEILVSAGMENPLVTPQNFYEALVEQARLLGYTDGAKYYRDPQTYQPPPPPPDPLDEAIEVEKAKTIGDMQKQKAKNELDLIVHKDKIALERDKLQTEAQLKDRELRQQKMLKQEELILRFGPDAAARPTE